MAGERTPAQTARGQRLPRMQRRAQLLAAAQAVFVDKGYHASGMEDIAERAGVSKPVLYQHFPGKLELYLALVDQHTAHIVELVQGALQSTENHKDRTYASIRVFFDFVARDDSGYRIVFESDLNEVVAVRERIDWAMKACVEAIASCWTPNCPDRSHSWWLRDSWGWPRCRPAPGSRIRPYRWMWRRRSSDASPGAELAGSRLATPPRGIHRFSAVFDCSEFEISPASSAWRSAAVKE